MSLRKQEKPLRRKGQKKFAGRASKSGLPPGSLILVGERKTDVAQVSLMAYGPDSLDEVVFTDLEASRRYHRDRQQQPVLWLNVHGLH